MTTNTLQSYILFGAGGHAAVVLEAIAAAGMSPPVAILDADLARHGNIFHGVEIRGSDALFAELIAHGVRHFAMGIGSVAATRLRQSIFAQAISLGGEAVTVVHPQAFRSPTAEIGVGSQLLVRAIVNSGAKIGDNVIVNTGAIVEHDCVVEDHAHLATGSLLAGSVRVGRGAHIGAGAIIKQGIRIGADAVVGAGAVVVKDVDAGAVVAGVPARLLRYLEP